MISTKVIPDPDAMHTACATYQSENPLVIGERTNHLENLDIETFEELLDPRFIRLDLLRAFLATDHVYLDWRLKRTAQRSGAVSETFIGLKLW
ncbi:hypothetical protein D9M68_921040 [compost metagenome]